MTKGDAAMTLNKVVLWVVGIFVIFGTLGLSWVFYRYNPVMESHYANYSDAEKTNAISKGIIPAFVPKSSTNIIEEHNLETNYQAIEFSFNEDDMKKSLIKFSPISDTNTKIVTPSASQLLTIEKLDFFKNNEGILAINWKQLRAVFWTNPEPLGPE